MTALIIMVKELFRRDEADCTATRKLASDYLEDGLSGRKRTSIQAHLEKCGPCRAFVETRATTIGVLSRLPRAAPPASLNHSVTERIRQEEGWRNQN